MRGGLLNRPPYGTASIDASNREVSDVHDPRAVRTVAPPRRDAPVSDEALLGETLDGRWTLERLIAKGAMGTVYLARQKRLDRHVAVKLLDPTSTADEPAILVERFHREAAILARLRHGNTVRVFDAGEWKGRLYLVMEHVDGWSLKRLGAAGAIPAERLIHIVRQIGSALHEAHGLGLIHRDLKPANILLTRIAGQLDVVKVVDFGLAKDSFGRADLTREGQVLGTPMYMAPEQIRDEACDGRADLYALGVLLFAGLTGRHPFELGPATQVMMAHLEQPVPTLADVAPDLHLPPIVEWTVRTALAKDRDERFATALELDKALALCLRALAGDVVPTVRLVQGHVVVDGPEPTAPAQQPVVPEAAARGGARWLPFAVVGALVGAAFTLGVAALL